MKNYLTSKSRDFNLAGKTSCVFGYNIRWLLKAILSIKQHGFESGADYVIKSAIYPQIYNGRHN